ncbi:MAG: VOC family protein [Acidimicrobiia bacterium]
MRGRVFQTAFVVDDVPAAMEEMSATLGVRWRDLHTGRVIYRTPTGEGEVDLTVVHSLQGPPVLELIGNVPGTMWSAPSPGALHHTGQWTSDLAADMARLEAAGLELAATGRRASDDRDIFAYYRTGTGAILELVDERLHPLLYGDPPLVPWDGA